MSTRPYNILLVEDDDVDAMTAERVFQRLNVNNPVYKARNGLEALACLRGEGQTKIEWPCVVLLDLNMPKMNGIEFLEELRKDPAISKFPVVILTTSKRDEDITQAYEKHVAGYIAKPMIADAFIRKMEIFDKYWDMCEF